MFEARRESAARQCAALSKYGNSPCSGVRYCSSETNVITWGTEPHVATRGNPMIPCVHVSTIQRGLVAFFWSPLNVSTGGKSEWLLVREREQQSIHSAQPLSGQPNANPHASCRFGDKKRTNQAAAPEYNVAVPLPLPPLVPLPLAVPPLPVDRAEPLPRPELPGRAKSSNPPDPPPPTPDDVGTGAAPGLSLPGGGLKNAAVVPVDECASLLR